MYLGLETRAILLFQRKHSCDLRLETIRGPENPVGKLSSKTRDTCPCQEMEISEMEKKKKTKEEEEEEGANRSNSYRRRKDSFIRCPILKIFSPKKRLLFRLE